MGIRRTNDQNEQTQLKKITVQYSYHAPSKPLKEERIISKKSSNQAVSNLFQYDINLIFADLLKTILITIFIFALLFGINWYLNR